MPASEKTHILKTPPQEIVKMFQDSVGLTGKKSLAMHPHLYSDLYNRASEIKALDKILYLLTHAAAEAKEQKYHSLPPILAAIKDTLSGKPQLSWWNLFTLSVGHALATSSDEEEKNVEEHRYLTQIAEILTEIIRNFRSANGKLLLEIRLAALDIDSRLVELAKIPKDSEDADETLDYLTSEFRLLNKELERIKNSPQEEWSSNSTSIFHCLKKANQLLGILASVAETNPKTYQRFIQLPHLKNLQQGVIFLLSESNLAADPEAFKFWQLPQLTELFELFTRIPNSIIAVTPTHLCTLLKQAEQLFVEDPSLNKKRPKIFASIELKHYVTHFNEEFAKFSTHMRAVIKGIKEDRTIKDNAMAYFKKSLMSENDLHHIAHKIRFKGSDYDQGSPFKHPALIQQEILNRMILLANISQPKELDAILKSFSDEEKENRYFLTQEVILEQFIRWRKQGIY